MKKKLELIEADACKPGTLSKHEAEQRQKTETGQVEKHHAKVPSFTVLYVVDASSHPPPTPIQTTNQILYWFQQEKSLAETGQ